MSEDRFQIRDYTYMGYSILDTWEDIHYELDSYDFDRLCVLLNELNEDSEKLQELYDFRLMYNALLFNEWHKNGTYEVYKSTRHHDGELCFEGEWFVVVAILPTGQITNHYHILHWNLFHIPEYDKVKHEFDGHTPKDVLKRLKEVIKLE